MHDALDDENKVHLRYLGYRKIYARILKAAADTGVSQDDSRASVDSPRTRGMIDGGAFP